MYEDAWFNPFVPGRHSRNTAQSSSATKSAGALLAQHHDLNKLNESSATEPPAVSSIAAAQCWAAPPEATLLRRAKSYSDFYRSIKPRHQSEKARKPRQKRSHDGLFEARKDLETELDLDTWTRTQSAELLGSTYDKYSLHLNQLRLTRRHLNQLLDDASDRLNLLSSISSSFQAVEAQTSLFQSRSDGLLTEQQRIATIADKVGTNLQYYNYLEPITRRLNAPGSGTLVRSDGFSEMLSNLDNCLDYMKSHPGHRESSSYQAKYKLLLTRALTVIRVHITNSLREIAADVAKRLTARQPNDSHTSSLLYARFKVDAPELKKLGLEIHKRAMPTEETIPGTQPEYQSLLNELHQSYTAARGRLILPLITNKIGELASASSTSKDVAAFARSSISYMRSICLDEYDLWREWFEGDIGLYDFLEAMCEPLFDHLRPRLIRETELTKLCEVCMLLHTRYMDDSDDESEPSEGAQLEFALLIRPALEDAQTRLVFLCQNALRNDIERFKPKPNDIDYPARNRESKAIAPILSGRRQSSSVGKPATMNPTGAVAQDKVNASDVGWEVDLQGKHESWYPTLQKAVWLLRRIYRLLNSTVFDDLAHQIVHQTTLSLYQASTQISARATPMDSQLFLLQHLLILKQQIIAFDIEFVTPEVSFDFSNVTNTFWELRDRGGLFNPLTVIRAIGEGALIPRVVENMLDAKAELDVRLRSVITEFTNAFAARMTAPLSEEQQTRKGFDSTSAVLSMRKTIENDITYLRQKLTDYLDDTRTRETLIAAIQAETVRRYETFFGVRAAEARSLRLASASNGLHGVGSEGMWDPETFGDWTEHIFGVGRLDIDVDDVSSNALSEPGSD